ncbi:MAG: helix-turn-helix transcriptional regulator [Lachnospiraceae bacterium]|nr:helix-turn-helix transcriptional regulator [Lachnospiraceae bacterium]
MDYTIQTNQKEILIENASKNLNSKVVDQLVALRKEKSMTQQDVAEATGINRANVARIERKKHTSSLEVLVKYANAVGKELDIILVDPREEC